MRKKGVFFIGILWASQPSAQGPKTAATCNQTDGQAAVTAEQAHHVDGDIISIPAGSCTWNSGTSLTATFTTSLTIQGAGAISATTGGASTIGTDLTVITNGSASTPLFNIITTAGKSFRITSISFKDTATHAPGKITIEAQSSSGH